MIKKISSSIFILFSLNSWAQESPSYISFRGEAGIVNNSFSAEQIWDGIQIGYWDADFKNGLLGGVENSSKAYLQAYDQLEYGRGAWSLSYQYKLEGFASISKDLLELVLFGNEFAVARELSFSDTYLDYLRYSEFTFTHKIGNHLEGSVALLLGHEFNKTQFGNSSLFTAEYGEYIDYSLNFTNHASDSTARGIFDQNGLGSSFGLSYRDTIGNSRLTFQASDIGFIKWNNKTQITTLKEELHFEGVEIEDILSFNDSLISQQTDTLLQPTRTQESYTSRIPFQLAFHGETTFKSWFNYMSYGLSYKPSYYENPLIYVSLTKSFKKHHLSCGLRGGGMQKLAVSAAYRYESKTTAFSLFTQQANIAHKPSAYGFHIGIGIKKVFLPKEK